MQDVRWSETIDRILDRNPGVPLTVWCDEDTPLIWQDVLAAISGHAPGTELQDSWDLLAQIMTPEGMARMQTYLATHPVTTPELRRKVVAAFLDKFAIRDRVVSSIDIPGWTEDTVEELTQAYDQDVALIRATEGVRFIEP